MVALCVVPRIRSRLSLPQGRYSQGCCRSNANQSAARWRENVLLDPRPFCSLLTATKRALSHATGLRLRAIGYKLPAARYALASVLDRLDLL
jgi:hypothetical protein